ncbi:MAG: hypothetical protein H0X49_13320 [Acidobacteria bacterium]|nr:hypothetical protein [Acidobacteriota bacterium]
MALSKSKRRNREMMDTKVDTAIAEVKEKTPLEKAREARALDLTNLIDRTGSYAGKPLDITDTKYMTPYLDIYGNADRQASVKKLGGGAMNLADTNSGYVSQLDKLQKDERYNTRASGLHDAWNGLKGEAAGLSGEQINADTIRRNSVAQMQFQNRSDFHRQKAANPWMTALQIGIQGLGAAGGVPGLMKI